MKTIRTVEHKTARDGTIRSWWGLRLPWYDPGPLGDDSLELVRLFLEELRSDTSAGRDTRGYVCGTLMTRDIRLYHGDSALPAALDMFRSGGLWAWRDSHRHSWVSMTDELMAHPDVAAEVWRDL